MSRPQPVTGDCDTGAVELEQPELSVENQAWPEQEVSSGDLVTYTILLINSGDGDAEDVDLSDELPAKVDFAGWIDQPAGAGVDTQSELTWNRTVAANSSVPLPSR